MKVIPGGFADKMGIKLGINPDTIKKSSEEEIQEALENRNNKKNEDNVAIPKW